MDTLKDKKESIFMEMLKIAIIKRKEENLKAEAMLKDKSMVKK